MPTVDRNVDFLFIRPTSNYNINYSESSMDNTIFFNARDKEIYVGNNEIIGQPIVLTWDGASMYINEDENYSFNSLLLDFNDNKKIVLEIQREGYFISKNNNLIYDENSNCFYVGPIYNPEDEKLHIYQIISIGAGEGRLSISSIKEIAMT